MKEITVPNDLTYISAFLTFRCNFNCDYCINKQGALRPRTELTANQWIEGLNRVNIDQALMVPITLTGGEPSKHKGFIPIIKGLRQDFYIDILTNFDFDIKEFMKEIPHDRLKRDVPYASIRVSYHHEQSDIKELLSDICRLQLANYSVGLFAVDHPDMNFSSIKKLCEQLGIDFRMKEFLGIWQNVLWGEYKYPDAIVGGPKKVQCRSTEVLIAPDGNIHKCHRDLYAGEYPVGNILDEDLEIEFKFRECGNYGNCNYCDQKIKNNRFQEFGTCSIEIKC